MSIPDTTVTDYDGQGRADLATGGHDGKKTWTTTTARTGDKTTVLLPTRRAAWPPPRPSTPAVRPLNWISAPPCPPSGSAATGFSATGGTTSATPYGYNLAGQQNRVTGPDKRVWTSVHDLLGRKKSQTDPDAGGSRYGYDDAGDLTSTTDVKHVELDYTYDLLGRKRTGKDTSKDNFEFASWTYDTLRIGLPTSSTRYVQGTADGYTVATTGYTTFGKPTGTTLTLRTSEAPLPSSTPRPTRTPSTTSC
ncbi:hypothetical protein ACFZCP_29370 [Streptomyces sp. NPDC007971]|uniref:hypothetical protein n=1 Tax=Streptomyces sp. NPDC007971 TaxID=3364799 RepID=UPI0036E32704